jgi:hypothetical protein
MAGHRAGNPHKLPLDTACKRAGITGFCVHDWAPPSGGLDGHEGMRPHHPPAAWGWSTIRVVERYAAVSVEPQEEAMRLVA